MIFSINSSHKRLSCFSLWKFEHNHLQKKKFVFVKEIMTAGVSVHFLWWFCNNFSKSLHKDKYGKPKKLNVVQLESIRRCGYVTHSRHSTLIHEWFKKKKKTNKKKNSKTFLMLTFVYTSHFHKCLHSFF